MLFLVYYLIQQAKYVKNNLIDQTDKIKDLQNWGFYSNCLDIRVP